MSDENTETILQVLSELRVDLDNLKTNVDNLKTNVDKLQTNVDKLQTNVDNLNTGFHDLSKELGQTQKWQDRTWDVIKWVGGISAGLSISAAIALVGLSFRLSL